MFAIPGLLLLVLFDYLKPQEYLPFLAGLPLLHVFLGAALLGFAVDLRLRVSQLSPAPQLALVVLFFTWCVITTIPRGAAALKSQSAFLLIPFSLYVLTAHAIQSLRSFRTFAVLLLTIDLSLAFVGAHQGLAEWGCHRLGYVGAIKKAVYDGRPCQDGDASSCRQGDVEPGAEYVCERVGLLGTQTVRGRARFLGAMEDPNELALFLGISMPLAFAFFQQRRTARRLSLVAVTVALTAVCAYLTGSRGGQVVLLVVLGVYFLRRFGVRGLLLGLACALPVLLFAARGRDDAAASTMERIEAWSVGMRLFWSSPAIGVGAGQFIEHHYITAHNSFVLAAAELGLPGMVLWTSIVYLSIKIPWQALRSSDSGSWVSASPAVRSWSLALAAALIGMVSGMLFLSYAYKDALWIVLGLSGALHQVIQRHDPSFRVRFGRKDLALVLALDIALAVSIEAYTRLELGH